MSTAQQGPEVGEALVEASNHVEDEGAIGDGLAEGAEIVGHLLEAAAVHDDGEIPLDEVVEFRLEVNGVNLPVAEELGLDGEPSVPGGRALGGDNVGEVVGEGVDDPRLDHTIHPIPVRREDRDVKVDLILQGVLPQDSQEVVKPATEVPRVDVEDNGDEGADVAEGDRLGMDIEEGGRLLQEHGGVQIARHGHLREERLTAGDGGRALLVDVGLGGVNTLGGLVPRLDVGLDLLLGLGGTKQCRCMGLLALLGESSSLLLHLPLGDLGLLDGGGDGGSVGLGGGRRRQRHGARWGRWRYTAMAGALGQQKRNTRYLDP